MRQMGMDNVNLLQKKDTWKTDVKEKKQHGCIIIKPIDTSRYSERNFKKYKEFIPKKM